MTSRTSNRRIKKLTLEEKIRNQAPENNFLCNEIVLATIPAFCPWPARIIQIINEMIMVEFFGTGPMCVVLQFSDMKHTDSLCCSTAAHALSIYESI